MIHLVYVSKATKDLNDGELVALLEQSRNRNKRQHITGMLLYANHNFIQVLEGESKDVEEVYDAIIHDDRNTGNILLIKEKINERTFPTWSMGFKKIDSQSFGNLEGYTNFLNKSLYPEDIAQKPDYVLKLLYHFKNNNR